MKKMNTLSIFWKIIFPFLSGFLLIILFFYFFILPVFGDNMMENKKKQLNYVVDMFHSSLAKYAKDAKEGKIDEKTAKEQALKYLSAMRFDTTNYVFVFNNETFIFHVNPKNVGKPLESFKDKNQKKFMVEMVEILKSYKDGYVDYLFPKPGKDTTAYPKLSYIKKFDDWGWYLGAGVYIDDVEDEMSSITNFSMLSFALIIALLIVVFILLINRIIKKPIQSLDQAAKEIANGNLDIKILTKSRDEIGSLGNAFETVLTNLKALINEITVLNDKMYEGKLDYRANVGNLGGGYAEIVYGINTTVQNLVDPLKISSEYMDRISKGDLPDKITKAYKGDFEKIKLSINTCIDAIKLLVTDANQMATAAEDGNLSFRANPTSHGGDFKEIIIGMNKTFDNVLKPLNAASKFLQEVASGSESLSQINDDYKGDYNVIKENVNMLAHILLNLIENISLLINSTENGNLNVRADAAKFQGKWNWIINGMNEMINGVIKPINEANRVLNLISSGVVSEKITAEFKGDFNEMKNSVNNLYSWLNQLIDYVTKIANGDMSAHIDKASDKDEIHQWLVLLKHNIESLTNDVNMLANSAVAGELSVRVKSDKHSGEYKKIVEGFNNTIDSILQPVNEAVGILKLMADGDLSQLILADYKGDHEILKDALNQSLDSLNRLLTEVDRTVGEVTRGALQVSDASTALSQGATEQAASLEEITSSMSEIASQTRHNAENANIANSLTVSAKDSAEKGKSVMSELNLAMSNITKSSHDISKIIKVIEEIAFQTNLLALNAAVEAARAGRHGKGFAVVAEEVRNLAARSANAAKETTELIENSIRTVENGMMLSTRTTEVLEEIYSGSVKSADIVQQIAELSNEQAMAISQINEGLMQIDKVTQTNTASAEESASASEELSGQASALRNMLSRFKLKQEHNDYDDYQDYSQYHNLEEEFTSNRRNKHLLGD